MNATPATYWCAHCNTQATAPRMPSGSRTSRAGWFCPGYTRACRGDGCKGLACPTCGKRHYWTATPPRGSAAYLQELIAR